MSQKNIYEEKTTEYIMPILEKKGFELYDVEYVKEGQDYYLRAYIDKPEGITINDCVEVSREMNEILDEKDYIKDAYIFEVSSPGLGRQLKKDIHFEKSIGEKVEIHTFAKKDGLKEFEGILLEFDSDSITIINENDQKMKFDRKGISLVKLSIDF